MAANIVELAREIEAEKQAEYERGYREGWAACAEMLRRERDALGRRLDSAGSGVCEEARAAE
jgi:flagellar biosynthesis/type III secretory pathway protein FliH